MKNYERYKTITTENYDKKTIMYYLCRIPSNKKIVPLLAKIKNKKILDVGIGTGYYARQLLQDNIVEGIDQNPHLCNVPVKLYKGDATELTASLGNQKFDMVFSSWMTEYLDEAALSRFFRESKQILVNNGTLMTTIISRYGFGFIYITLAKLLKGIDKFNYHKEKTVEDLKKAGFQDFTIINLNSWFCFPWAYMVIAK